MGDRIKTEPRPEDKLPAVYFRAMAVQWRDRVAIDGIETTTTYAQLLDAVLQCAQAIRHTQIPAGCPLAIEQGDPEQTVAVMLAALTAGVPYCVLPGLFSREQKMSVVEDLQAFALWTKSGSASAPAFGLPVLSPLPVEAETRIDLEAWLDERLRAINPGAIAYIAYTSGSTGKPKGVMQTHANIMHEVLTHTATLGICHQDVISGFYAPDAIGSVRDIFGALLNGAGWVPCRALLQTPHQLAVHIRNKGITHLHMVPSLFRACIDHLQPGSDALPKIKTVFLAGDEVRWEDVKRFRQHFPSTARFYTGLGSSEATSIYTHWFVTGSPDDDQARLPVGYPLPDKEVSLVDPETREKVPGGGSGEICVTSRYLSPGYWRQPALTDRAFARAQDGTRCYYTGDMGRWDEQGRLMHLGRKDRQVKINGQRIEIAAIELALRSHPDVDEVIILSFMNPQKRTTLAAYFTTREDCTGAPPVESLCNHLRDHVPAAAMPAVFMRLDHFPRTGIGKIDAGALPSPAQGSNIPLRADSTAATEPEGGLEAREAELVKIFAEILGIATPEPGDDFRLLGGDSLAVMRLASVLHRRFGIVPGPDWMVHDKPLSARSIARLSSVGVKASGRTPSPYLARVRAAMLQVPRCGIIEECGPFLIQRIDARSSKHARPLMIWVVRMQLDLEWANHLADHRDVWIVPSGYEMVPGDAASMTGLMEDLAEALANRGLPDNFQIGGYCCTGVMAAMLANGLKRRGHRASCLVFIDCFGTRRSLYGFAYFVLRVQRAGMRLRRPFGREGLLHYINWIGKRLKLLHSSKVDDAKAPAGSPAAGLFTMTQLHCDAPAWDGPVRLVISKAVWRWRWLLGTHLGWSPERFPGIHRCVAGGDHISILASANRAKLEQMIPEL
jgi:acyl-coenzyme A synthetase/AMP-(fatty) acid ligase/acyl carrier protein